MKNFIINKNIEQSNNILCFYRQKFCINCKSSVTIKLSAYSSYTLLINGKIIGRGSPQSINEYPMFDTYELEYDADFCMAVEHYYLGKDIPLVTELNQNLPYLWFEVKINEEIFCSNDSVKTIVSPSYFRDFYQNLDPMANRISAWGGFREVHDTTLEIANWTDFDYNDSSWDNAVFCSYTSELGNVIDKCIKPLVSYQIEEFSIVEVHKNLGDVAAMKTNGNILASFACEKAGSFPTLIIDFERERVGYLELTIQGDIGGVCSIWYGESISCQKLDTFILNGKQQVLRPYSRRAFRYIRIECFNSLRTIVLSNISFAQTHYPLTQKKNFIAINDRIQQIFDISLYTTQLASQNHYEDSIFREQMQWLVDARIMSLVNLYCFSGTELIEKSIRQFARTICVDGAIRGACPEKTNQLLPDYCMHYITMVAEWVKIGGGKPDNEIMSSVRRQMKWFEVAQSSDGLLSCKDKEGWWCFLDWADIDKREKVTALNCLYYKALVDYHYLTQDDSILAQAQKLKARINEKMFNRKTNLYCDCLVDGTKSEKYSQQSSVYALISGVCDNPKQVINTAFSNEFVGTKINGVFLMSLAVDMLFENGESKKALDIIENCWGQMADRGATTWWETFDMSSNSCSIPHAYTTNNATYKHEYIPVSFCHAWGAGVAFALCKAGLVK